MSFKQGLILLLLCSALLAAAVSCSDNAAPLEPLDGDIEDLAGEFIACLVDGDYDGAYGYFSADMRKAMSVNKLRQTWEALLSQVGAYAGEVEKKTGVVEGYNVVFVTTAFEKEKLVIRVVFDGDNRVSGLWFDPAS